MCGKPIRIYWNKKNRWFGLDQYLSRCFNTHMHKHIRTDMIYRYTQTNTYTHTRNKILPLMADFILNMWKIVSWDNVCDDLPNHYRAWFFVAQKLYTNILCFPTSHETANTTHITGILFISRKNLMNKKSLTKKGIT